MLSVYQWSNLVCLVLVAGINIFQVLRANGLVAAQMADNLNGGTGISPETILMLSIVLAIYLLKTFFEAKHVRKRMKYVCLSMLNDGVEGVSLSNPTKEDIDHPKGLHFSIKYAQIHEVSIANVLLMRRQTAPALLLDCGDMVYTLPALEDIVHIKSQLTTAIAKKI